MQKSSSAPGERSRSNWTKSDDDKLRAVMSKGPASSWVEIAQDAFPDGRHTTTACLDRWKILSKPKSTKGPWSQAEDTELHELVQEMGAEKWVQIASRLGTRSGKQCRERWHNHLDPGINKAAFTPEEDAIIFELYSKIGSKWAEMSRRLPGRPDNAIKNHFNTSLQRSKRRNSNTSAGSSTSASSSVASANPLSPTSSPVTASGSRYSPYRSRRRTDSSASLNSAVPVSPSPLSAQADSRSSSPQDLRTPSSRKPDLRLSLGRNLERDFSGGRRATFMMGGPLTAPAEYASNEFDWSSTAAGTPVGPLDIDPALQDPDSTLQSAPMLSSLSDSSYRQMRSDFAATLPSAYDSSDSNSLIHSLSTSSFLTCSTSSSSPSTPPGIHSSSMQPYVATSYDYDPYEPRFSLTTSPSRPAALQRTNSMPCYPTTPPSPSDARSIYPSHFSPSKGGHPLGFEINYQSFRGPSYYAGPDDVYGHLASPANYLQRKLSDGVDSARDAVDSDALSASSAETRTTNGISAKAGRLSIEDIPGFAAYQSEVTALESQTSQGSKDGSEDAASYTSPSGSPRTASSVGAQPMVIPSAPAFPSVLQSPPRPGNAAGMAFSSPASAHFDHRALSSALSQVSTSMPSSFSHGAESDIHLMSPGYYTQHCLEQHYAGFPAKSSGYYGHEDFGGHLDYRFPTEQRLTNV